MSSINKMGGVGYSMMSPMRRQDPGQGAEAIFSKLKGNDDGEMRGMRGPGNRPPPRSGEGPTLSKDELSRTLSESGASDNRSKLMTKILNNFETADTDGDGKVSFQEATAYDKKNPDSTAQSSLSASSAGEPSYGMLPASGLSVQLRQQIRQITK